MPAVFQPYTRLGAKPSTGLGLGLYLAREIVAAHGGTIEAESILGEGTVIAFGCRPKGELPGRCAGPTSGGRNVIRLAIIEDHPAIAEGLTALLGGEPDVTVVGTARTRRRGRSSDRGHPPSSSFGHPSGRDGGRLEILARHNAPIIMLSAYTYPSYYVARSERGAKGYLSKMASIGADSQGRANGRPRRHGLHRRRPRAVAYGAASADPRARHRSWRSVARASVTRDRERLLLRLKTVESQLRRMFDRYDVTSRTSLGARRPNGRAGSRGTTDP